MEKFCLRLELKRTAMNIFSGVLTAAWLVLALSAEAGGKSILGLNYSKIIAPKGPNGEAVDVQVGLYIVNIRMDEPTQVIQFDCYFRTVWLDKRLHLPVNVSGDVQMDTAILRHMWVPNIFFVGVQNVDRPSLLSDASGVCLFPNNTVFHSSLYLTKVTCRMDYRRYPMDSQVCRVQIQSYGYTEEAMKLSWHISGIRFAEGVHMRTFDFKIVQNRPTVQRYIAGVFSDLSFDIQLHRKMQVSFMSLYAPSIMFLTVSWLSLLVPAHMVPGRMVLAITTLLTLTSLFNSNYQDSPQVSYVTAFDVWILACIMFVFGTIVEYIIVLRLTHQTDAVTPVLDGKKGIWTPNDRMTNDEKAAILERLYRICSLLAFFVFNIVYWIYYLW